MHGHNFLLVISSSLFIVVYVPGVLLLAMTSLLYVLAAVMDRTVFSFHVVLVDVLLVLRTAGMCMTKKIFCCCFLVLTMICPSHVLVVVLFLLLLLTFPHRSHSCAALVSHCCFHYGDCGSGENVIIIAICLRA